MELPDNLDNLWKALTFLMSTAFCSLLIYVIKQHLTKMDQMFKEFTQTLTKLVINDAVQDEKLETHDGRLDGHDAEFREIKERVYVVKYRKGV